MEKIFPLLLSFGLPATIIGLLVYFTTNKKKSNITTAVTSALHTFKQQESEKQIQSIETEQTKVIAVIKDQEDVNLQTQKRIRAITDKAVEKIEEVKKTNNIKDVQKIINDNWEDL